MWFKLAFLGLVSTALTVSGEERHRYDFPNPRINADMCGRKNMDVSYVCDPDNLLEKHEADQLDRLIGDIIDATRCACSGDQCAKINNGYKIGIAVIDKMKYDYVAEKKQKPKNVNAANMALDEAIKFSYTLLHDWNLGQCEDDLIIFYSKKDKVVYTMTGTTTAKTLPSDVIADISIRYMQDFNENKIFSGLTKLLEKYSLALNGKYVRNSQKPEGPKYLAVIGNSSTLSLPGILITMMMAIVVALLH